MAETHSLESETERQRDRETERQRDREKERKREREKERKRAIICYLHDYLMTMLYPFYS
jgi:hypothetical protein